MFIIRNATLEDVPALLRMAKTVRSNNLPADERELTQVVERSLASFAGDTVLDDRFFTFVLIDESTGDIAGTSAIIARRGTPARPRLYLKVRRHQHYSQDLQAGQMQTTVQLMQDTDGVTEVGGLVLAPAYRGGGQRLRFVPQPGEVQFHGTAPGVVHEPHRGRSHGRAHARRAAPSSGTILAGGSSTCPTRKPTPSV